MATPRIDSRNLRQGDATNSEPPRGFLSGRQARPTSDDKKTKNRGRQKGNENRETLRGAKAGDQAESDPYVEVTPGQEGEGWCGCFLWGGRHLHTANLLAFGRPNLAPVQRKLV
jgi:hypothetical protein